MSGVSINEYQEVVAELAEQIQKYGDARSAHDKSAGALIDLGTHFNKTAIALGTQINNTVGTLEKLNAAVSASNNRASQLQDSLERSRASQVELVDRLTAQAARLQDSLELSAASQIESVDRLSARADDHHKLVELKFQELNSRLDMLNAGVSRTLFWLYGVIALLVLTLLMVIVQ